MRAAIQGDASAYGRLLVSLTPRLRSFARRDCARLGMDNGEAEDIQGDRVKSRVTNAI
jgi:RNA polymerase sigma-70 factor (ECF subfamily)